MIRNFQIVGGIILAGIWMACGVVESDTVASRNSALEGTKQHAPYQLQLRLEAMPKQLRDHVLSIIDVGDLPDGIIDVGDLPDGIIDVGDLPDGIIDVGDLPDGIIDVGDLPDGIIDVGDLPDGIIDVGDLPDGYAPWRPVVPFSNATACKALLGMAGLNDTMGMPVGVCVGSSFKLDAPCALFKCSR